MAIRKIVHIDESKCNGCGLCIPNCVEGALKIIDGKARLVSDVYCDGLGACLGHCPQDAIEVIEREAVEFDEQAVEEFLAEEKVKENKQSNQSKGCSGGSQQHGGCPGSRTMQFKDEVERDSEVKVASKLRQWPVQMELVPPNAPYLKEADLLITADCVPIAYGNYHNDYLKGRSVVMGCPKLDDLQLYIDRLTEMIKLNNFKSITVLRMEVPCCGGMAYAAQTARDNAGAEVKINVVTIGIQGDVMKNTLI